MASNYLTKNSVLSEHTKTEERIPDMARVALRVMLYVLIGFHSCDCSQYENSETAAAAAIADMHNHLNITSRLLFTIPKLSSQEI